MERSTVFKGPEIFNSLLDQYDRVFRICLGFTKNPWDAEELMQEVGRFVEDVRGVRGELTGAKGIANVAEAITEEVINLHLYLENKERKKKLREEIEKKYYPDYKK